MFKKSIDSFIFVVVSTSNNCQSTSYLHTNHRPSEIVGYMTEVIGKDFIIEISGKDELVASRLGKIRAPEVAPVVPGLGTLNTYNY